MTLTKTDKQAIDLDTANGLAEQIKECHAKALESIERGLGHAIRCGEYLTQAKPLVGHGGWEQWLAKHCKFSNTTAAAYVRVFKQRKHLAKQKKLTFAGALASITALPGGVFTSSSRMTFVSGRTWDIGSTLVVSTSLSWLK